MKRTFRTAMVALFMLGAMVLPSGSAEASTLIRAFAFGTMTNGAWTCQLTVRFYRDSSTMIHATNVATCSRPTSTVLMYSSIWLDSPQDAADHQTTCTYVSPVVCHSGSAYNKDLSGSQTYTAIGTMRDGLNKKVFQVTATLSGV
jgi:hypothetical protein